MRSHSKVEALAALGRLRRSAAWPGYKNTGDYHDGAYDCDHVSPYTKTAGNVDAEVMILLQDWSSNDFLQQGVDEDLARLGYAPSLQTNRNLCELLDRHFGLALAEVYATNLFPFVKRGAMNTQVPTTDLIRAAREFAVPQIDIVEPRIVICLGLATFNALRKCCGHRRVSKVAEGIDAPFEHNSARIHCQAHTGGLGRANRNRGGVDLVNEDWSAMAKAVVQQREA